MAEDKRLYLLDAYALIYRSYYAFIKNPRINSKGLNTSAIFGFTLTLDELLRKENPSHIAVVFDTSAPTFRHILYEEYKANRPPMPEDLRASVPHIRRLIEGFRISIVESDGYEADDVIGTLAKKAEKEGFTVYMMTPDKDFAQLVDDRILMMKPRRSGNDVEILGPAEVCRDFEIERPEQVIDILALMGDTSDNVPGAPGIGPKTASTLIRQYGSVEGVYQHLGELKGKQKETLEGARDKVLLSKELVTICTEAPVEFNPQELARSHPDDRVLKSLFEELEFRNLMSRILNREPDPSLFVEKEPVAGQGMLFDVPPAPVAINGKSDLSSTNHHYRLLTTPEDAVALATELKGVKEIAFDTETTGLDALEAELVGLALSWKAGEAVYLLFPEERPAVERMLKPVRAVLESETILKIGQNIKYDYHILLNYGVEVKGPLFDTMLAHYLINPDERHNLNLLADRYLSYRMLPIEELIGEKGKEQRSMRSVEPGLQKEYAGEDADITFRLKPLLEKELGRDELTELFERVEMPLVRVLADMERAGIRLDSLSLADISLGISEEIQALEQEITGLAGVTFNLASPKQLGDVLFDHLKIDAQARRTRTGQYSTGEEVLSKLANKHPIINKILEYRGLTKLLNTYIDTLPGLVRPQTGKIHTSFNQAITSTGRLSSINPNLQNIPIREDRGREIRKAFVPSEPGHLFLSADYSQIELRVMAHFSEDVNMIAAFNREEDIHTATAALINRINPEKVTREMRTKAKVANFGIIYGISSFGLSQRLNVSRSEASDLIDGYFKSYPGVKAFMDQSIRQARDHGYVTTLLGRRRYLPDIASENAIVRGNAERNAINSPIQGSAADIIKIAMVKIHQEFRRRNLRSRMVLQVHDELNFDVHTPELQEVKDIVRFEMERAVRLRVPLLVEMGTGRNWLEAHG
ncbi:MAG: DNA polymerase I [Bacteroidales bacterium]